MRICYFILFFWGTILLLHCNEGVQINSKNIIIGHGQMPSVATDSRGDTWIVYGAGDSIMCAVSRNKGQSFSLPALVTVLPGLVDFAMRGPQVSVTNTGACIIACTKAGNIFSYTGTGDGNWSLTGKVNDIDTVAKEGFTALSADGDYIYAAWLDLRNNNKNKLVGASSGDGGKTWSKNILVYASPDSSICECCKPSVIVKNSNVFVMFRNWLNGNRDMYLIESADGGHHFGGAVKLGKESWFLDGCPMAGGGLALNNGVPQTVWRRKAQLFTATPTKGEVLLGEGSQCSIENINGYNVYAWIENEQVVVLLPNNKKIIVGKGALPLLKTVDAQHLICVWQQQLQVCARVLLL